MQPSSAGNRKSLNVLHLGDIVRVVHANDLTAAYFGDKPREVIGFRGDKVVVKDVDDDGVALFGTVTYASAWPFAFRQIA